MIDSQLRTSGVNAEFVLARMNAVAREDYVPEEARKLAYIDRSIPLANGRRLAAPVFYGRMLEEARPTLGDTVLVVDSGSGYLPALVQPLVENVETILPDEAVQTGDKQEGFTLLLIDGAVEAIPDTLVERLATNGRLVTGLWSGGVTRLATGRRSDRGAALLALAEMGIPHLPEFDKPKVWNF